MAQPSVKQMLVRSNEGHRKVLRALAAGEQLINAATPLGSIRGYRTCLATLRGWGCIEGDGVVTAKGFELLEAYGERKGNGS